MSARFLDFLLQLTRRERVLLAGMAVIVVPLAVIFGLILPLQDQRNTAEQAQKEAVALQRWVSSQAREQTVLSQTAPQAEIGDPIGSGGIEQGLIEAQLRQSVTVLDADGEDGIELQFERVDFLKLASWLRSTHPEWGYDIVAFRLEETNEPGVVSTWLDLRPPKN
ncbi:type II secretion system protein GspM [uncultured Shimia sp.]|uniref:type II secretion system protein GspM n=1 Tax=uncultured Shimia sp. TaxID=573152 RepID=UPI0025DF80C2|nr:type II secretion system protein GspM [uncultured Shimia sp.]